LYTEKLIFKLATSCMLFAVLFIHIELYLKEPDVIFYQKVVILALQFTF